MKPYDGPAMAEWIDEQPEARGMDDTQRRILRRWRSGSNPTEQSVDALLCRLGLHLSEVPAWAVLGCPPAAVEGLDLEIGSNGKRWLVRAR